MVWMDMSTFWGLMHHSDLVQKIYAKFVGIMSEDVFHTAEVVGKATPSQIHPSP